MSRTSKAAVYGALIALAVSGGVGGYELYQRQYLSSDLKRTLSAATDPSSSEPDILTYIRDARLQVHTERDQDVLQRFQTAVQLARDSSEISNRLFRETMQEIESLTSGEDYATFNRLIELRSEYWKSHIPVPKDLEVKIDQALADARARHEWEQKEHEADEKRAKAEADTARRLYNGVRLDLGLPPLTDKSSKTAN